MDDLRLALTRVARPVPARRRRRWQLRSDWNNCENSGVAAPPRWVSPARSPALT